MTWSYWITLYLQTHCTARGLCASSINAYQSTLVQFREYVRVQVNDCEPDKITARDVLQYLDYLRRERNNGACAINRQITVLRNFYRAIVAMGHLEARDNPLAYFPKVKAARRKLPVTLNEEEVRRLIERPRTDSILGLRDRAMLTLLYGTGIRASECAGLREQDIDWQDRTIRVVGKGGHERTIPLNVEVRHIMKQYQFARGPLKSQEPFFRSREGGALSRNAVYERVRSTARAAQIEKRVSPHRLRHTFATHLIRAGVGLVTVRDLLGHRLITSTQIYIHLTAQDLREAADRHPIADLIKRVEDLLPNVQLPFQYPPGQRFA
ncbi:MAG: tyrosine-type recombinase/integrase [Kiritimatiellaeota bacterium]|nr:tyrosine-type recombinase/integrase [Kiritimatiellota bacterium]